MAALLAVVMPLLLAACALALESGRLALTRETARQCAEAGALAGLGILTADPAAARAMAEANLALHFGERGWVEAVETAGEMGLTVRVAVRLPLLLLPGEVILLTGAEARLVPRTRYWDAG